MPVVSTPRSLFGRSNRVKFRGERRLGQVHSGISPTSVSPMFACVTWPFAPIWPPPYLGSCPRRRKRLT